jgi:hypothetical protein
VPRMDDPKDLFATIERTSQVVSVGRS